MVSDDIDTLYLGSRIVRGWPWIFILAVLGAVAGWAVSEFRPPLFASHAVLGIGIDYGRSLPLDDRAQEMAMDRVRALLLADDTMEASISLLSGTGTEIGSPSPSDFRRQVRLEDMRSEWYLTTYADSPEQAAQLANAWAQGALRALHEASLHAWRAAELQAELYGLGCTLEPAPDASSQPLWTCAVAGASADAEPLLSDLLHEAELSRGVLPGISYALLQEAEPPDSPVLWGRGWLILSGLVIGAILGVLWATRRKPGPTTRR
ncbi:MAG: hypothetical protein AB1449_11930 [Chloroflexota bacterium]